MKNKLLSSIMILIVGINAQAGPGFGTGISGGTTGAGGGGGTKPTTSLSGVDMVKPTTVKPARPSGTSDSSLTDTFEMLQQMQNTGAVRFGGLDRSEVKYYVAPDLTGDTPVIPKSKRLEEFTPSQKRVIEALKKSKDLNGKWIYMPAEDLK
ncbi:MAG: hypothetical protein BroJett041_23610 [Candidatus Jettenia caeni]|nr:MAG: hypothetical protein BroJett041_23610 [Candidatus Jettenia caeni]